MKEIKDIRYKEWINDKSKVSLVLKKLIEVEDLLIDLDEYNTNNNLDYDNLEDFMLQIGELREEFTDYVEKNTDLKEIK
jgi:hypothetical protein